MAEEDPPHGGPGAGAWLLRGLDPDQRAAVVEPPGPLLVVAGAGSGKTRMLTHRAAWAALRWGLAPEGVLVVSFTNKAVEEMRGRLRALLGEDAGARIVCLTFHAAAWRIVVRPHRHRLERAVATIYSHDQSLAAMRRAIKGAGLGLAPGESLARIGWAKANGLRPSGLASIGEPDRLAAQAWLRYRAELREAWAADYEDLVAIAVHLLESDPAVAEAVRGRFGVVLVDEYQDASPAQQRMVELVCGSEANLTVVADDDQALYSWRGGDARGVVEFRDRYPEARRLALGRNYRSGQAIVEAAARLVGNNPRRTEKGLRAVRLGGERAFLRFADQAAEARGIAAWVAERIEEGRGAGELCVLSRTARYSRPLEAQLGAAGVPYRVLGRLRLLEHAEVRDVVAFLALCHNPHNREALGRAAARVRGVGAKTLGALVASARGQEVAPSELLAEPERVEGLGSAYRAALGDLGSALGHVRAALADGLGAACEAAERASGWRSELAGASEPDERSRAERLVVLREIAERAGATGAGLEEFLGQVALSGEGAASLDGEAEPEGVTIATIHASKGLEWPCVWVAGAVEGELPHHRALAGGEAAVCEERRVAYVALTRAMDELVVSAPLRVKGREGLAEVSRFIAEAGLARGAARAA